MPLVALCYRKWDKLWPYGPLGSNADITFYHFILQPPSGGILQMSLYSVLFSQESIVDASEDSQLRAAIAASLACTTSSTQNEESSDDDGDDFDDLEFSESDSEEERKTPQKNINKTSAVVKKEVKREINFDESTDKTKGACKEDNQIQQNERVKNTDSVKKNTTAGAEAKTTNKLENNEADVREADSTSEEKDHSSNQRTQEQAGECCGLYQSGLKGLCHGFNQNFEQPKFIFVSQET